MTAVPERRALRADDGTWLEMPPDVEAVIAKLTRGPARLPGLRPDGRRAAAARSHTRRPPPTRTARCGPKAC